MSYSNLNMDNKTKQKIEKHVISPVFNFTKRTCKFHSGSKCFKRLWLLGLSLICLHGALCCVSLGVSGPLLRALGVVPKPFFRQGGSHQEVTGPNLLLTRTDILYVTVISCQISDQQVRHLLICGWREPAPCSCCYLAYALPLLLVT